MSIMRFFPFWFSISNQIDGNSCDIISSLTWVFSAQFSITSVIIFTFLLRVWFWILLFYSLFFLYPPCNYRPKQDLNLGLGKSELLYRWPKLLSYYCWEVILPGHCWLWWHEERLPMLLIRHKMEHQLEEDTVTKKEQDKIKRRKLKAPPANPRT